MPEATFTLLLASATKALAFDTVSPRLPVMMVGGAAVEDPIGQVRFIAARNGAGQLAQPAAWFIAVNAAAQAGEDERPEHMVSIFAMAAQSSTSKGTCEVLQFGDSEDSEAGQLLLHSCIQAAGPFDTAPTNDAQFW